MKIDWQPIETAPRDLTEVLVFDPNEGVLIAQFEARAKHPFWSADTLDLRGGGYPINPTKWAPKPTAPE